MSVKHMFGKTLLQKMIAFDWIGRVVKEIFEGDPTPNDQIHVCNKCGLTLQPQDARRSATCPNCRATDVRQVSRVNINSSDLQALGASGTLDLEGQSVNGLEGSTVNVWTCSECGRNILRPLSSSPPKTCPHCGKT